MPNRPAVHARDSSGRQVSLLNDEPACTRPSFYSFPSSASTVSLASSSNPGTPDLERSHSYDSHLTREPMSPMTPTAMEFTRPPFPTSLSYQDSKMSHHPYPSDISSQRPSIADSRSSSFGDYEDERGSASSVGFGSNKRYPCRFKDSHGCEKTFTTSGHASRHSKIHTAEKAVQCQFPGCQKKFTRADNMKQHLETHYKERSRASASKSTSAPAKSPHSPLTVAAGVKKSVSSGRSSRAGRPEVSANAASYYAGNSSDCSMTASPISKCGSLDMAGFHSALLSHPVPARIENCASGLDALAMAVACTTGRA